MICVIFEGAILAKHNSMGAAVALSNLVRVVLAEYLEDVLSLCNNGLNYVINLKWHRLIYIHIAIVLRMTLCAFEFSFLSQSILSAF